MTEAVFGLIGVLLGGLLQGSWSLVRERRRDAWAARKAGRLFGPNLHRCHLALDHALSQGTTWGELGAVVEANLDGWPEHAELFAGTLEWDEWFEIYAAVRALEQLTVGAPIDAGSALITPGGDGAIYLAGVRDRALRGAVQCSVVGFRGVKRRPIRGALRTLRDRLRPTDDARLMEEALAHLEPPSSS